MFYDLVLHPVNSHGRCCKFIYFLIALSISTRRPAPRASIHNPLLETSEYMYTGAFIGKACVWSRTGSFGTGGQPVYVEPQFQGDIAKNGYAREPPLL